jgi:hypothetical protein
VVVGGRQDLLVEGDGPGVRALLREHSADLFR